MSADSNNNAREQGGREDRDDCEDPEDQADGGEQDDSEGHAEDGEQPRARRRGSRSRSFPRHAHALSLVRILKSLGTAYFEPFVFLCSVVEQFRRPPR